MTESNTPPALVFGSNRTGRDFYRWIGFIVPYIVVLAYFAYVDVYHDHFFETRQPLPYNLARIVFTGYFFGMIYFTGRWVVARRFYAFATLPTAERLAIGFFAGAAVWTLAMLVLGYLSLYYQAVAAVATVIIIACSHRDFYSAIRSAAVSMRTMRWKSVEDIGTAALALACVLVGAILLGVKGLYPAGGHDYFTHYFYYYVAVIKNHSIWPNEVWYHYYYSKGLGLTFLGMLLTDPLAPSLVTFCFSTATATALFSFVNRVNPGTAWPFAAVILYLALYIYTPGTGIYLQNGGWGDFQKPHEINAAFMIAILWASTRLFGVEGSERALWFTIAALCAFVTAFVTSVSSLLIGVFFLSMAVVCAVRRSRRNAFTFLALACVSGLGLTILLAVNYVTTGLPLDNGSEFFWPIVNLRRLRAWGVLSEALSIIHNRISLSQHRLPLISADMRDFLLGVFRSEILLLPLQITLLAAAGWMAVRAAISRLAGRGNPLSQSLGAHAPALKALGAAAVFLFSVLVLALVTGSTQPISFVRYASFMLPLLLGTAAAIWQLLTPRPSGASVPRAALAFVLPCLAIPLFLSVIYASYRDNFVPIVRNAALFVGGKYSIYDAYVHQEGWPAGGPGGAIRSWALETWRQLGPDTRFWVFDVHTYCMIASCRPEAFMSFRLSPRSQDILLGSAESARDILQQEKLNYFLIAMDDLVRDPLPCSALFSPDHIAKYFGLKWTDGTHFLLTWTGPDTRPLTAEWLTGYRRYVNAAPCGYLDVLRQTAPQLENNPHWGGDLKVLGGGR